MSNYLSIAATTAVFSQKIQNALNKVQLLSAAPQVVHRRPEKNDGQMIGVNLYLYDIEFNHGLRNNDLATRRPDGSLIQQPQVPLNLKYHLSFYGQDLTLEPQKMMGATIVELHAEPFITPSEIMQYQASLGVDSLLASANLHTQQARIKIEPIMLSLEDVTKMWSSFFQLPHQHSLNYEISVILIESDFPIEKALPVHSVSHATVPKSKPVIESLSADYLPYFSPSSVHASTVNSPNNDSMDASVNDATLSIFCRGADSSSMVRFEDAGVSVQPDFCPNNVLRIVLPAQSRVGLDHLQISRVDSVDGEQKIIYSDPYPFIVQPYLGLIEYRVNSKLMDEHFPILIVDIFPFPRDEQSVIVWLNNLNIKAPSYQVNESLKLRVTANIDALNQGDLTELSHQLLSQGITLSQKARLSTMVISEQWLLQDEAQFFTLHKQGGTQILLCYGFEQLPSMNSLAFKAEGLTSGNYIVRVQIDQLKFGQSPLSREQDKSSRNYGRYIGPMVVIE